MPAARFVARANETADALARWASLLAGIGLFAMMLIGAADILAGKLLGSPIPGTFEATEALLAAAALLPLAHNRTTRTQIRVDFVAARLPCEIRVLLAATGDLLAASLFGVLAWQGWKYALKSLSSLEYQAGPVAFPVYPAKIILAVAFSLMALTCLARAFQPLADRRKDE